jgi:hypothetical protein
MLNKQVKAGKPVLFKYNGGQTFTGIVKQINGGPDPDGAAVVVEKITPPIPGHPNMTLDARELTPPAPVAPVLPEGPPFTAPTSIVNQNGTPISPRNYYLFSTYAQALAIQEDELAALAAMPDVQGVTSVIVDGIGGTPEYPASYGQFVNNAPPSNPPLLTDVTVWVVVVNVQAIKIPAVASVPAYTGPAQGTDVAGDLIDRELQPNDLDQGPTGERGGNTLYMRALAPTNEGGGIGTIEGYWNPAVQ